MRGAPLPLLGMSYATGRSLAMNRLFRYQRAEEENRQAGRR